MSRVNINQTRKVLEAHRLAGPHVRRVSNLIIQGARRLVPRGDHRSGSGKRQPGLTLGQSLKIEPRTDIFTISERIGSDKRYAATVHQGSEPHFIHGKGKMLKFQWDRGNALIAARSRGRTRRRGPRSSGGYFFFVSVFHPGNKRPVRYLTTPMHLYGRLHGFVTSSARVNRTRLP